MILAKSTEATHFIQNYRCLQILFQLIYNELSRVLLPAQFILIGATIAFDLYCLIRLDFSIWIQLIWWWVLLVLLFYFFGLLYPTAKLATALLNLRHELQTN